MLFLLLLFQIVFILTECYINVLQLIAYVFGGTYTQIFNIDIIIGRLILIQMWVIWNICDDSHAD